MNAVEKPETRTLLLAKDRCIATSNNKDKPVRNLDWGSDRYDPHLARMFQTSNLCYRTGDTAINPVYKTRRPRFESDANPSNCVIQRFRNVVWRESQIFASLTPDPVLRIEILGTGPRGVLLFSLSPRISSRSGSRIRRPRVCNNPGGGVEFRVPSPPGIPPLSLSMSCC